MVHLNLTHKELRLIEMSCKALFNAWQELVWFRLTPEYNFVRDEHQQLSDAKIKKIYKTEIEAADKYIQDRGDIIAALINSVTKSRDKLRFELRNNFLNCDEAKYKKYFTMLIRVLDKYHKEAIDTIKDTELKDIFNDGLPLFYYAYQYLSDKQFSPAQCLVIFANSLDGLKSDIIQDDLELNGGTPAGSNNEGGQQQSTVKISSTEPSAEPPAEPIRLLSKPGGVNLDKDKINEFFKVIQHRFSSRDHAPLLHLLDGQKIDGTIFFRGQASQLADTFGLLHSHTFIGANSATVIDKWLAQYFLCSDDNGNPVPYKVGVKNSLNLLRQSNSGVCKFKLIQIEKTGKITGIQP
jgi:hypothetical protein